MSILVCLNLVTRVQGRLRLELVSRIRRFQRRSVNLGQYAGQSTLWRGRWCIHYRRLWCVVWSQIWLANLAPTLAVAQKPKTYSAYAHSGSLLQYCLYLLLSFLFFTQGLPQVYRGRESMSCFIVTKERALELHCALMVSTHVEYIHYRHMDNHLRASTNYTVWTCISL